MNRVTKHRLIAAFVLADFLALTAWAFHSMGWDVAAMFAAVGASPIGIQVGVDLFVALSFVVAWMWKDARKRGMNPIPFAVGSFLLGSIVPLFYLVVRREPAA